MSKLWIVIGAMLTIGAVVGAVVWRKRIAHTVLEDT